MENELPKEGFVRLPVILTVIPVSKAVWWKGVKEGVFPKGVKFGPRTTAWRVEDIRKLIADFGREDNEESQEEHRGEA